MTRDGGDCPDLETIAAYIDGRLPPHERSIVAAHLAECQECYFVFTEAAQTHVTPNAVDVHPSWWRAWAARPKVVWSSIGGALATAAAVWLALASGLVNVWRSTQPELQALVVAVGTDRTIEGRLSGGFAYGPVRGVVRAGDPSSISVSPDVRIAAAQIEKNASADRSPRAVHALGVAYLVLGDSNRAVLTLEQAADATKTDPTVLSDLSAAYLARAVRSNQPQDFAKSLTVAERATHDDPRLAEAWFNRAYALERLSLSDQARKAWQDYLKIDSTSGWADEARRRLKALEPSDPVSGLREDGRAIERAAAKGLSSDDAAWFVKKSPDAVREWAEGQLLTAWSTDILDGRPDEAAAVIARVRPIANAFASVDDDRFLRDAVDAATRASRNESAAHSLATANQVFERAAAAYDADRRADSAVILRDAIPTLDAAGSAFAAAAARYRAIAAYDANDFADAAREVTHVEESARARKYARLLGLAYRLEGLIHVVQGDYARALDAYQAALRVFQSIANMEAEADINASLAEAFQLVGDTQQSWHARQEALSLLAFVRDPIGRYRILQGASLSTLREDLPEASLYLQEAALESARAAGRATAIMTGYLNRAAIFQRLGASREAATQLAEAERFLASVHDPLLVARNQARIALARGETLVHDQPVRAIAAVNDALEYFTRAGTSWPVASAYLARGRAHIASRRPDLAEQDFRAGIDVFERMRSALTSESLRTTYFEQPWDLFSEMVRLEADRHDANEALRYAEQARARTLLERVDGPDAATPLDVPAVQGTLPPSIAIVYYSALDDRLLTWVLTHAGRTFVQTSTRQGDVMALVERWRTPSSGDDQIAALASLYDLLIRPLSDSLPDRATLVFVPDGVLHAVPFAALLKRENRRYLVEEHAIATTPSLTMFARSLARTPVRGPMTSALVVGDPQNTSNGVASLPDADREANAIASLYTNRRLLTEAAATKATFVEEAGRFEVVHFAGHGVSNDDYPPLSRLILAGETEGDRSLFAGEIAGVPFTRTELVVLAACRTSAGRIRRGEGVLSLARPFIAAGVPSVVASLWDVDDRAAHAVFVAFHRALRDGAPVTEALRAAQLASLAEKDAVVRNPANWGSFLVIGGWSSVTRVSN